jgi:REP element-mobilizing transposase RayT
MVRAYHVIFCAYGFWLPNDPRGSWSDFVGAWELLRFGRATKTCTRQSRAGAPHDDALREEAKHALEYPPVSFTGIQARAVARGFAEYVAKAGLSVWACSILPEHVHMVIARDRRLIEQIVNHLKGSATRRVMREDLHPLATCARPGRRPPHMWGRGQWTVYLDDAAEIRRAIRYVQDNPLREGKRRQRWRFVTEYAP